MRKKLAAGNWKMNGLRESLQEIKTLSEVAVKASCEVLICPPATLVQSMTSISNDIIVGGQDCHADASGAHTGDISAAMLADCGAQYVILGHSERREDHGETDELVREKTRTAWSNGLTAIVCVGESLAQREASNTIDIIGGQLAASIPDNATGENLVVAYEPVWAIGTGLTPTLDQIGEVHDFIRMRLERRFGEGVGRSVRLLYGGSMNPKNAADIAAVSNVDGGLVGGASLKAADFSQVIAALS
ncbi:triose-phosphate isomerase [Amylibacter sp. SFDW26]|uniref:triose-phosphate isomerase n=1 Tax=Amylibacter sp. SFDW26 TaxID=2652722 RepID=UPI001261FD46|nr:triose-phosphate isomerase [Amylibacter sp. SFDW26]KAB7615589.1 triose-phosphate isomerase [Amylibacter sp. SFDW26]